MQQYLALVNSRITVWEEILQIEKVHVHILEVLVNSGKVYAHIEINNDLSDFKDNFNGLIIIGLKSNLFESISIYSEIRNDYDTSPSKINIDKNEFLVTMGLAYNF